MIFNTGTKLINGEFDMKEKKVGKVIRIEYDEDEDRVILVMEITDPIFKNKVIHHKDFQDILSLSGKDVIASE